MIFYFLGIVILILGSCLIWKYFTKINKDTKLLIGIKLQMERLKICIDCEHIRLKNTIYRRCAECGCFLNPKTKLIRQSRPIGKWHSSE